MIFRSLLLLGALVLLSTYLPWRATEHVLHKRDFQTRALHRRAKIPLKILPIGDSITQGYKSSDGNGYRLDLLNDLQNGGYEVTYVGEKSSGTMANNAEDGYDGYTINQIAAAIPVSLNFQPNIVLLHAGTNDMNKSPPPDPYASAPERLGSLIDDILCKCPNTTLIVAQIISAKNSITESRMKTYNAAIPGVVAARRKKGFKVMTVDMSSMDTLEDGLHPTDDGYDQMATFWYKAIQGASARDWITPGDPETFAGSGSAQRCASGLFWYPAYDAKPIATGVGTGGNFIFDHSWQLFKEAASGIPGLNGTIVQFGDLDGDGKDEYLWINKTTGAMVAYRNQWQADTNTPGWAPINNGKHIASGVGNGSHVRIADVTGDGKVDYLYVSDDGAVTLYQNLGPNGDGWTWNGGKRIASGISGATASNIFFADINGDNRADYLLLHDNGALEIYLNIGNYGSADITWYPQGQIASGLGTNNVTLADIDGDGRADYLIFDKDGGISGYLNKRSDKEGHPTWIQQGSGNSIASGAIAPFKRIRMADINGDGKADYVVVNETSGAIDVYINNGRAATWTVGDGVHLADMDGDGIDDYVQINDFGAMTVYKNGGPPPTEGTGSDKSWLWYPINGGFPIATGIGIPPRQVRIADLNGDGKADYITVDPKTGAVSWYENGGPRDGGGWVWYPRGKVAGGIGDGAGVTFADIDGDGRDDYIWLDKNGAATVYINAIGVVTQNWISTNGGKPIASGIGASRERIRFADLNGDGRADYIALDTLTGRTVVYHNGGPRTTLDGGWIWLPQGQVAGGIGFPAHNIIFGRLVGTGRAAYIAVASNTGAITAYLNGCKNPATPASSSGSSSGSTSTGGDETCGSPPLSPGSDEEPTSIVLGGTTVVLPSSGTKTVTITGASGTTKVLLDPSEVIVGSSTLPLDGVSSTTTTDVDGVPIGVEPPPVTSTSSSSSSSIDVTSTMTTFPSGISTIVTTNTRWTRNQWITTTVGGKATEVPVIQDDDGKHNKKTWIVIFGVPDLPKVQFKWPGFPKFHLPCIKILGITIGVCPPGDDPKNDPVNDGPPDEPSPPDEPTPSESPSETSTSATCTSSTFTSCTKTVVRLTTVFSGADSSTVGTSTTTTCHTVTACSGTGTTKVTTTATATTEESFCEPSNCGDACAAAARRALETPTSASVVRAVTTKVSSAQSKDDDTDGTLHLLNHTLHRRNVIAPGTGDWSNFYGRLPANAEFKYDQGVDGTESAIKLYELGTEPILVWLKGLKGCFSVIAVSRNAMVISHFWENPTVLHDFQNGVTNILQKYLGQWQQQYLTPDTVFYIVAGTSASISTAQDGAEAADRTLAQNQETITNGMPLKHPNQVNSVRNTISNLFPSSTIEVWSYYLAPTSADQNSNKGFGKIAFQFDPRQTVNTITGLNLPGPMATWQLYIQGAVAGGRTWPNIDLQIWRKNTQPKGSGVQAANYAYQFAAGSPTEPCGEFPNAQGSEFVNVGSHTIDVGKESTEGLTDDPNPFDITLSNGATLWSNCIFSATNLNNGNDIGNLACDGVVVNCPGSSSYIADTCSDQDVSACGPWGGKDATHSEDCVPYARFLAGCRL